MLLNEEIGRIKSMMGLCESVEDVFADFPEDLLKYLQDQYGFMYQNNFDWNEMSDRYNGPGEFNAWRLENEKSEFIKQKHKIITAIRSDLINTRKSDIANEKTKDYEDYLISLLGHMITLDDHPDILNIDKFEDFIKEHPKYEKAYYKWVLLHDESMKYSTMKLNSFRVVDYEKLKDLYNFLVKGTNQIEKD